MVVGRTFDWMFLSLWNQKWFFYGCDKPFKHLYFKSVLYLSVFVSLFYPAANVWWSWSLRQNVQIFKMYEGFEVDAWNQ